MAKVSIIIPVKALNDYIRESMEHILKGDFQDFEVLIFTDYPESVTLPKTRIIPSGPVGPAQKRDMALEHARGEILAFLDDDAYPRSDWLARAVHYFERPEVAAVCGPAVTPDSDPLMAKLSGAFYTSYLGSGTERYRYWPGKEVREVTDYPSVNFLIRKSVFAEIGGFRTHYWPGEDTKLCLEIVKKGYKMIYDPEIYVWHHRRNSLKRHLLQIFKYALHRGHFAKRYPETSLKWVYFIPTLFTGYCLSLAAAYFFVDSLWLCWYGMPIILYMGGLLGASLVEGARYREPRFGLALPLLFFVSHITYGVGLVLGLSKKELNQ